MNNACLVFDNGKYIEEHSQLMQGITITERDAELKIDIAETFQTNFRQNPLMLLYHQTGAETGLTRPLHPRLILSTEENVQLKLIEINLSQTFDKTEIHGGPSATLRLELGARNVLEHEFFSYSGKLTREIFFKAEFSAYQFRGLLSPRQNNLADLNLQAHHQQAHCKSNMQLRSTVRDTALSRFLGQILIDPAAIKTQASLDNKNLLLSLESSCYTQPYLEINTDDIVCSHGATVSHLEEDALFYLRSRGITEQTARAMLIASFIAPVVTDLRQIAWEQYWNQTLHPLSGFKMPIKSLTEEIFYEPL